MSEALDEARRALFAKARSSDIPTGVFTDLVETYTRAVRDNMDAQWDDVVAVWERDRAEQAATIQSMREALQKIARDEEVAYLACSDLPMCNGGSTGAHASDCAVGIARAALASLQHQEEQP